MDTFRRWLNDVTLPSNPIQREQTPTLQALLLGMIGFDCFALLIAWIAGGFSIGFFVVATWLPVFILALRLLRKGAFSASLGWVTIGMLIGLFILMMPDGIQSVGMEFMLLTLPIILAGLLGSRRLLWFIVVCSIGLYITLEILEIIAPTFVGYREPGPPKRVAFAFFFSIVVFLIAISSDRFSNKLRTILLQSLDREQELEYLKAQQERLVAERTAELRTALAQVEQREQQLSQTLAYLRTAQDKVRELSIPVLPVLPRVLTIPLVGEIDEVRANVLMTNALALMERDPVQHFIFDMSSVTRIDQKVAAILIKTADALKLMDARVLLVGVQPEVAQTMISLGRERNIFSMHPDLRAAISSLIPDR